MKAHEGQPDVASVGRTLLVGMMGCGKTTVGQLLARQLGIPYLDNDALLVEMEGKDAAAILAKEGVNALRRAETRVLEAALAVSDRAVLAVAAGAVLDERTRGLIAAAGDVVWLRARPETLAGRIGDHAERPRFATDMTEWLRETAEARAPLYAEVARHIVDVDGRTPASIVQEILNAQGLRVRGWLPGGFPAVVLDLDGLLVETETIWLEAKRRLFARHGVTFGIEDHRALFGTSEEYTAVTFARRFGLSPADAPAILREYLATVTELFRQGVTTRPGARELVAALRGRVPLGLASNTRRELVELVLERAELTGSFDTVVCGDDAPPKPEPDIYRLTCQRLGVAPAACVAVEDSPTGIAAAKAAGLTCIAVPSDEAVDLSQADRVVPSLVDLLEPGP